MNKMVRDYENTVITVCERCEYDNIQLANYESNVWLLKLLYMPLQPIFTIIALHCFVITNCSDMDER